MNTLEENVRVRRGKGRGCPVEATLSVIGGRWKPRILHNLLHEPQRFNELRRRIPEITQRMLTSHLRDLEKDGIIHREVFAVVPPRVEYSLTPKGRTLQPIMAAMAEWGEQYVHGAQTGPAREAAE